MQTNEVVEHNAAIEKGNLVVTTKTVKKVIIPNPDLTARALFSTRKTIDESTLRALTRATQTPKAVKTTKKTKKAVKTAKKTETEVLSEKHLQEIYESLNEFGVAAINRYTDGSLHVTEKRNIKETNIPENLLIPDWVLYDEAAMRGHLMDEHEDINAHNMLGEFDKAHINKLLPREQAFLMVDDVGKVFTTILPPNEVVYLRRGDGRLAKARRIVK